MVHTPNPLRSLANGSRSYVAAAIRRSGDLAHRAARRIDRPPAGTPSDIDIVIGRYTIAGPADHLLGKYRREIPQYSVNVGTVAAAVAARRPAATAVDIGANIGDTAAFIRADVPTMPILCVEGNPAFIPYLRRNVGTWEGVSIAECFVSDDDGVVSASVEGVGGTAHVVMDARATIVTRSVDALLEDYPRFGDLALLKSDTDGFEAKILRGAVQTLRRAKPLLFLEFDPRFLRSAGDSGIALLTFLRDEGYGPTLVYDNFGRAVTRCSLAGSTLFDMHDYVASHDWAYYDIAVAPLGQESLIDDIWQRERLRWPTTVL